MLIDMNMRETETTVYMLIEVDLYLWFQQSSYRSFSFLTQKTDVLCLHILYIFHQTKLKSSSNTVGRQVFKNSHFIKSVV